MTPEQSLAATALQSWTMNITRAEKVFSGLTDEQLQQPIAPGKNRLVYLWGHLIAVHDGMLPLLAIGPRLHPELDAPFLKEADSAATAMPSAGMLKKQWAEVNAALQTGFDRFTPAEWTERHTSVSEADFAANPLRNRLAVLLSRTGHVAYHLGQCVLAPKAKA
ncbi:MAG: DinB family protein [Acidobacteriota bacterium]